MENKEKLLTEVRTQITQSQDKIKEAISRIEEHLESPETELAESEDTRMLEGAISEYYARYLEQLHNLHPSPYFARLDLETADGKKVLHIGKFTSSDADIISWTAPVASLRFENPGSTSYESPEEGDMAVQLLRKDQYMIVNGTLTFFTHETTESGRQLVYQEYLSGQNRGFALPEIVAQMEKAQDAVIRAEARGNFAITGPAGSGKTTLALHRLAFLTQTPDTAKQYPAHRLIVFVGDKSTKAYFSALLPQLGIHDVAITTFSDWAMNVLSLKDYSFTSYINWGDSDQNSLECNKIKALRSLQSPDPYRKAKPENYLEKLYKEYLTPKQLSQVKLEFSNGAFDRYDLTALLRGYEIVNPGFASEKLFSVRRKNGSIVRESRKMPLAYPLIVIDEFQNYLPEQLEIISNCISPCTNSTLYVGDLAQQTHFGSITSWEGFHSTLTEDRRVNMGKVYRNTRQILRYIQSRGYSIEIQEGIKSGSEVQVLSLTSLELSRKIADYLSENQGSRVGIIALHENDFRDIGPDLKDNNQVHILTARQSQGVEFDLVIVLESEQAATEWMDRGNLDESKRIERDLLYVAFTRAIRELQVVTLVK